MGIRSPSAARSWWYADPNGEFRPDAFRTRDRVDILLGHRSDIQPNRPDASLAAWLKAAELQPGAADLQLQVGIAHALASDFDGTFEWLFRARDSNAVNMALLDGSPARPILNDDPRYASLFPTAEAFEDPFVEEVRILREWRGENRGDQFGWIARNIGDVDADGVDDLATSAPTNAEAGSAAGKIYVYSSGTGRLLWSATGPAPGGQLGFDTTGLGDVDGDGTPDMLVTSAYSMVNGYRSGRVFILGGDPSEAGQK